MKTITKEINLLDIEDIEQALSEHLGRKVAISEVGCTLVYCIPMDTEEPNGAYLEFQVGSDECSSFDVLYSEDEGAHCWQGKKLALDEPWLPVEEIFNFDVSAFKSFDSWTDSSD